MKGFGLWSIYKFNNSSGSAPLIPEAVSLAPSIFCRHNAPVMSVIEVSIYRTQYHVRKCPGQKIAFTENMSLANRDSP